MCLKVFMKLFLLSAVESRTQRSRPRRRTQKKSEAKAKDSHTEDRSSWGQEQECSRPRPRTKDTGASVLQKKVFEKTFRRSPIEENKQRLRKFSARFLAFSNKILTVQKIVLSSSRGQGNFGGHEASRPRTWLLRPRPRTSKCVLEDVFEESTFACYCRKNLKKLLLQSCQNLYQKQSQQNNTLCISWESFRAQAYNSKKWYQFPPYVFHTI